MFLYVKPSYFPRAVLSALALRPNWFALATNWLGSKLYVNTLCKDYVKTFRLQTDACCVPNTRRCHLKIDIRIQPQAVTPNDSRTATPPHAQIPAYEMIAAVHKPYPLNPKSCLTVHVPCFEIFYDGHDASAGPSPPLVSANVAEVSYGKGYTHHCTVLSPQRAQCCAPRELSICIFLDWPQSVTDPDKTLRRVF